MYKFYNPHPQGKIVGDCVKRAFTKATGRTYQEVSSHLNTIKRQQGASAYNSKVVWTTYLEELNAKKLSFPAESGKPRMNGERFCEEYPVGTYILRMAGHLSTCVDGVIYDSWDCSDKCVYTAWEISGVDHHYDNLVPMPGTEKLADLAEQYNDPDNYEPSQDTLQVSTQKEIGNELITKLSKITGIEYKTTRKGEMWIPLTAETHAIVLKELFKREHLRWETKRGSKKSTVWCEETGMKLILKNGNDPYIWCIEVGTH